MPPGVEASLGVAALIASQWAGGGAGEAACAGDRDRACFAVVRREGQGGTVGLGSSHRRGDAGPALQPRRKARASHQRMAERSGAQRPARLAGETLAEARSMEGPAAPTPQSRRSHAAHQLWCDRRPRLCHWLRGPVTIGSGEVGRPDQAVEQPFQPRHAPHSRRPRQPAGGPCCPLGRPAAADPGGTQAGGATDPPPATAAALKAPRSDRLSGCCPPQLPSPCLGHSGRHRRRWAPPSSACRSSALRSAAPCRWR